MAVIFTVLAVLRLTCDCDIHSSAETSMYCALSDWFM
jgi:hypothetical protein